MPFDTGLFVVPATRLEIGQHCTFESNVVLSQAKWLDYYNQTSCVDEPVFLSPNLTGPRCFRIEQRCGDVAASVVADTTWLFASTVPECAPLIAGPLPPCPSP